jgi:tetratricopeptide (TPR) repeat protein
MIQTKTHTIAKAWYIRLSDSFYFSATLIIAGLWIIYENTLHVPFLFDDESSIINNTSLRHLRNIIGVLNPPNHAGVGGRPLLNLSYALNYALGGIQVEGYHITNLLIHTAAALLLLLTLRITFKKLLTGDEHNASSHLLALITTAIWAWHPILTISVTYISQRAESLMGFFYILTFLFFVLCTYSTSKARKIIYSLISIIFCLCGILTKEVMLTAPLIILFFDRLFISGSFCKALRQRILLYSGYALSLTPLIYLTTSAHYRGVGFDQHITPWEYALHETKVVIDYIFLIIWPHTLVFDYGWYIHESLGSLWPYCLITAVLLYLTILSYRRSNKISFFVLSFFVLISPTSSFIPVASQPMAENRLYLAILPLSLVLILSAFSQFGRKCLILFAAIAIILGVISHKRNTAYQSELSLWEDTVKKIPLNARAHVNLGLSLSRIPGREKEAVEEYALAVKLKPDSSEAHNDLGEAFLHSEKHWAEGVQELRIAIDINPQFADAHYNLGTALLQNSEHIPEAIKEFKDAIQLNPEFSKAYYNLGNALIKTGNYKEAIAAFHKATAINPYFSEAYANLGTAYYAGYSDTKNAIKALKQSLEITPNFVEAHYDLANILSKIPNHQVEAIHHYNEALRLNPNFALAHNNYANLLAKIPGRENDAIEHYRQAVHLMPTFAIAHYNLGLVLLRQDTQNKEAHEEIDIARRLDPSLPGL